MEKTVDCVRVVGWHRILRLRGKNTVAGKKRERTEKK